MIKFLINRPVAVLAVFLAIVILGLLALRSIPVTPLPNINIPFISIKVNYPGRSAWDLEEGVVKNLRGQLMHLSGVQDVNSTTSDGAGVIRLAFDLKADLTQAFLDVNEKIDFAMNSLPREMERPMVIRQNITDIPVFYLHLTLKDQAAAGIEGQLELSNFAENVVKRRLEQLKEVSFIDMSGLRAREIYIRPDAAKMRDISMDAAALQNIIQQNNIHFTSINIQEHQLEFDVRLAGAEPKTTEDIRQISFKRNDRIFILGDIADVGICEQKEKGFVLLGNDPAVSLAVIKHPDSKQKDLLLQVRRIVEELERAHPDIAFTSTENSAHLLDVSLANLQQDLLAGLVLSFTLLFLFVGNFRAALLIVVTVPVCLMLSIVFFYICGISINIISLAGVVLGLGLMIDNTIIVIDNIYQQQPLSESTAMACISGTNGIIRPLLSSAFTTCSVFIPLIFLSGFSGALFFDQAIAITICVLCSYIVSVSLLPTLYNLLLSRQRTINPKKQGYIFALIESSYERGLTWVFRHKRITFSLVIVFLLSNVILWNELKRERMPYYHTDEFVLNIDWNEPLNVNENKRRIQELLSQTSQLISQSVSRIGTQQYLLNNSQPQSHNESSLYFRVNKGHTGNALENMVQGYFRDKYPHAYITFGPAPNIFEKIFGTEEAPLNVSIPLKTAGSASYRKVDTFRQKINKWLGNVKIAPLPLQQSILLQMDKEKMAQYDLTTSIVEEQMSSYLNARKVGEVGYSSSISPLRLYEGSNVLSGAMRDMEVKNAEGVAIPLRSFTHATFSEDFKFLEGGRNGTAVRFNIQTNDPGDVVKNVRLLARETQIGNIVLSGSHFSNQKEVREMVGVLLVAIGLLYFILAAQFESLIQPLIVLLELPISISGALIMLYVFNSSINLMSLIGLVVICGIIINDSIMKIDTINQLRRKENMPLLEAIHYAGKKRLKSIIMTSLTTIFSILPFMFGSDLGATLQRPLALTLIGGMFLGTLVSIFFIPLIYWYYYRKRG